MEGRNKMFRIAAQMGKDRQDIQGKNYIRDENTGFLMILGYENIVLYSTIILQNIVLIQILKIAFMLKFEQFKCIFTKDTDRT